MWTPSLYIHMKYLIGGKFSNFSDCQGLEWEPHFISLVLKKLVNRCDSSPFTFLPGEIVYKIISLSLSMRHNKDEKRSSFKTYLTSSHFCEKAKKTKTKRTKERSNQVNTALWLIFFYSKGLLKKVILLWFKLHIQLFLKSCRQII